MREGYACGPGGARSGRASAGLHDTLRRGGKPGKLASVARRALHQHPAAVGTFPVQCSVRASRAESAFEGTDTGVRSRRIEIGVAAFAVGAHLEHAAGYRPQGDPQPVHRTKVPRIPTGQMKSGVIQRSRRFRFPQVVESYSAATFAAEAENFGSSFPAV
jgi:hypothetical protein